MTRSGSVSDFSVLIASIAPNQGVISNMLAGYQVTRGVGADSTHVVVIVETGADFLYLVNSLDLCQLIHLSLESR